MKTEGVKRCDAKYHDPYYGKDETPEQCILEGGHEGDHKAKDPIITVHGRWSRQLRELGSNEVLKLASEHFERGMDTIKEAVAIHDSKSTGVNIIRTKVREGLVMLDQAHGMSYLVGEM